MDFQSISFTDVSRHFGRRRVLNKINFRCTAGEIVALVGANGAGKSTLLGIAATLLTPSSGRVHYGDAVPASSPELRARIGVLGHDLFIYPELSAAENPAEPPSSTTPARPYAVGPPTPACLTTPPAVGGTGEATGGRGSLSERGVGSSDEG